jgi:hypothetical protein
MPEKVCVFTLYQQIQVWLTVMADNSTIFSKHVLGRSDIFQFYLHNGKFCNSVLHLKTAAVTMH